MCPPSLIRIAYGSGRSKCRPLFEYNSAAARILSCVDFEEKTANIFLSMVFCGFVMVPQYSKCHRKKSLAKTLRRKGLIDLKEQYYQWWHGAEARWLSLRKPI